MRTGVLCLFLALLAIAIACGAWLRHRLSLDSCLDRGGAWDGARAVCVGAID